ncbi:hydrogenase expression protein HupK, partial [archaeon]
MHEWALAESVKESVLNLYRKHGSIKKVKVSIGGLQQIDLEIFKYALKELIRGTKIENVDFEITVKTAKMRCNVCGYEWDFKDTLKLLGEDAREAIHFIP